MIHHRRALGAFCAVLFATVTMFAQQRTAMRISIGGVELPAETQPRAIIEQQRGAAGEARIEVSGSGGLAYAAGIAAGVRVEVAAFALDGTSLLVFTGTVVSVEMSPEGPQPFALIRASGAILGGETTRAPHVLRAGPGGDARLLAFAPRLSSSASIQEVLVTGTDASTGLVLIGRAVAPTVNLGGGSDEPFGRRVTIESGRTFSSAEEANAFAALLLAGLVDTRISAEAVVTGIPDLGLGTFVEVEGLDARFDGAYYVSGVSHRFGPDSYGGFSSSLRLRRADLGMFLLPEIDDEVLVGFEHGDVTRPYILGSWWDCGSGREAERSDDSDQCRLLRWPW
jgi:type VI secretion system (T6SS) baseplate-like injector VgrG